MGEQRGGGSSLFSWIPAWGRGEEDEEQKQVRMEVAKKRWEKTKKLRLLFMSVAAAKDEMEEQMIDPIHGLSQPRGSDEFPNHKPYIIYPLTYQKGAIETIAAVLILYFCFVTPYRIGFGTREQNEHIDYYEMSMDVGLFLYLILSFFMAFYEDIEIVDDLKVIASRYLRGMFLPDLVACLPLYLLSADFMWLKMLRLLRVGQVSGLLQLLFNLATKWIGSKQRKVISWSLKLTINKIIQFAVHLVVICHCIACFWHYVAMHQGVDLSETWKQGVLMTNTEAYVVSLYWTMVTFTTVGYGDITPKTDYEIIVAMVVEFVGILFFAYLMGNVSSIVSNINQRELALSKRESDLEKWLMMLDKNRPDKRLSPSMHTSIRSYFLYIWKYDHSFLVNESDFYMRLPVELRETLRKHLFEDEIENFRAFLEGTEEDFAYQLVLSMFPRRFRRFDQIIPEGAFPTEISFIERGSVYLSLRHGSQVAISLPPRSFFGDFELIFNVDVEGLYQAGSEGCELYCVTKSRLIALLQQFPRALEAVARRAYRRMAFFECVTRMATLEASNPLDPLLVDLRAEAERMEESFRDLTEQETEKMFDLLQQSQLFDLSNKKEEEMERSTAQYLRLEREVKETRETIEAETKRGNEEKTKLFIYHKTVTANTPLAGVVASLKSILTP